MATKIVTKNSSTSGSAPLASDLVQGELAVNVTDKRLYTENASGVIVEVGTNPSTLTVTGEITANGGIALGDNDKATFGAGDDLQIYHDGSNSIITDGGTGSLLIRGSNVWIQNPDGSETGARFITDGAIDLRYDNAVKLATTSTGIDVTGNMESDSVTIGVGAVAGTEKLRVNGTVLTLGGTNSVPAIGIGDVNTGIYAPTVGTLGWTVNGTQKLLLNSTGIDVTGTITSDGLTVDNTSGAEVIISRNDTSLTDGDFIGGIKFGTNDSSTAYGTPPHYSAGIKAKAFGTVGLMDMHLYAGQTNDAYEEDTPSMTLHYSGDISFYEDTGTTPKFFWDASAESLSIGKNSLSYAATDRSNVEIKGTASALLALQSGNENSYLFKNGTTLNIHNQSSGPITFDTAATERMRIDASGNVGIGTSVFTSNAIVRELAIKATATDGVARYTLTTTDNGLGAAISLSSYLDGNALIFGLQTSYDEDGTAPPTERMRIDSSGNLLVGKSSAAVGTVGVQLESAGSIAATRSGGNTARFNRLASDGDVVQFQKDGATVGSIGSVAGVTIAIDGGGGRTGLQLNSGYIGPRNNNNLTDNVTDLGSTTHRFKDLYLSGGVYLGGTGAANKLDDYEEGTWTPTIVSGYASIASVSATYTKVGDKVTVWAYVNSLVTGNSSAVLIGGLPFTSKANQWAVGSLETSAAGTGVMRIVTASTQMAAYRSGQALDALIGTDGASHLIFSVTYSV